MHPECARSHPNNVENRVQTEEDQWTHGTQRDMVEFVHASLDPVLVKWNPKGLRDKRYSFKPEKSM